MNLSMASFSWTWTWNRVLGKITKQNVEILRKADEIFINKIKEKGLYNKIWQAFCVLLQVKTVGVMGDNRTYEKICIKSSNICRWNDS